MYARSGNVVVTFAILSAILLGMAAIAVDLGALRVWQLELHDAAEAGAHAGAARLDGTEEGMANAYATAVDLACDNFVAGAPVSPGMLEVELGRYTGGVFTPDTSDPLLVSAVRVRAARSDLDSYFAAAVFGKETLATADDAMALSGGPSQSDCPLPIAIPSCVVEPVAETCNLDIAFGTDGADNAGWALLGDDPPSGAAVKASIDTCIPGDIVDHVSLMNGSVASAAQALASTVAEQSTVWDAAAWGPLPARSARSGISAADYGHVLWRRVIVFDDPTGCANPRFNGTGYTVTGFATAVVYDVDTTGAVEDRAVRMRIVCDDSGDPGGGGFFGTWSAPRMVEPSPR